MGTLVGSVALRPNTPLTATVIATTVIVGMTMVFDAAYALGWIPASIVHVNPILLYANGACHSSALGHTWATGGQAGLVMPNYARLGSKQRRDKQGEAGRHMQQSCSVRIHEPRAQQPAR